MCYEDIKEGQRRWSRITAVSSGAFTTIPGDSSRVLVRLMQLTTAAGVGFTTGALLEDTVALAQTSQRTVLMVNSATPTDEITLEKDGTVVQQPLGFTASVGTPFQILQVFAININDPPVGATIHP